MKVISSNEAIGKSNSNKCEIIEYPFHDGDLDLVVATITGRYPEFGYCMNEVSKELIYVIEGKGALVFEDKKIDISKGDAILIHPNEKYYWNTTYCVVTITCNPPWNAKQYKCV